MATSLIRQPTNPIEALDRLGPLFLRERSMHGLLQAVADVAKAVLPGQPEASVTLLIKNDPATVVSTGQLALDLDQRQYERGHGPCLHAARSGELTEVPDTRTEPRWPDYMRRAAEQGNLSSLSAPLVIAGQAPVVCGALNLYSRLPNAFTVQSRSAAVAFGNCAAVAAGNIAVYLSAQDRAEHLQAALESRPVIEQAKGVLIERYKLTPDQAFHLLAQASMTTNTKLRDVADHLVHTGELPTVPRRTSTRPVARRKNP
jgi:GAF domain-containing protein